MIHVRIVKGHVHRRAAFLRGAQPQVNKNLCGADLTLQDLQPADVRKCLRDPEWRERVCPRCAELLASN